MASTRPPRCWSAWWSGRKATACCSPAARTRCAVTPARSRCRGGRCDPGEAAAETALREAWEEIGLEPGFVSLTGQTSPFLTDNTGYHITPVVGFVRPGFTLAPNPAEVAVIFEAPFDFLMDPQTFQEQERDFGQGLRRFYAATHQDQLIWGATAQILIGLRRRLYD